MMGRKISSGASSNSKKWAAWVYFLLGRKAGWAMKFDYVALGKLTASELNAKFMEQSRKMATAEAQAIEAMIRVFIEQTGFGVLEIELVRKMDSGGSMSFWVRRRGDE